MNIRRHLTIAISVLVALTLISCSNIKHNKIKSGKDITFFVTTDVHYLAKNLSDGGEAFKQFVNSGDGKNLDYIWSIMDAFAHDIKEKKPDILIISGDLTTNGEKESHIELAKRLNAIKDTGTLVYVIPGNHDILNPYARSFKGNNQYKTSYITPKDFSKIYSEFGYKEAISRDKTSLSYLAAPSQDLWLLMLDTAEYDNNIVFGFPEAGGKISPETLNWIKQCSDLAKSKGAKIITVTHHNLIDHSEIIRDGYTIDNSKEAVSVFRQAGIDLNLSGHIHLQDIKSTKDNERPIYDIATSCLSMYPQKYGVLKYSPKEGFDYSTSKVNVTAWAKETKQSDKNLINFDDYSKNFYGDSAYSKIVSRLGITDLYTDEELKLMGETYKQLSIRYFEGAKDIITDEIKNSPGYKLWMTSDGGNAQKNISRFSNINGEENNKLHIPVSNLNK